MKDELWDMLDKDEQERYERMERHRIVYEQDIAQAGKPYAGMQDALEEARADCALYCKLAEARKETAQLQEKIDRMCGTYEGRLLFKKMCSKYKSRVVFSSDYIEGHHNAKW